MLDLNDPSPGDAVLTSDGGYVGMFKAFGVFHVDGRILRHSRTAKRPNAQVRLRVQMSCRFTVAFRDGI
jgi:hypothetical protein